MLCKYNVNAVYLELKNNYNTMWFHVIEIYRYFFVNIILMQCTTFRIVRFITTCSNTFNKFNTK